LLPTRHGQKATPPVPGAVVVVVVALGGEVVEVGAVVDVGAIVDVGAVVEVGAVPPVGAVVGDGEVPDDGAVDVFTGFTVTTTDHLPHESVTALPRTCPAAVSSKNRYSALPPYVTWRAPPARLTVPSFAALTPLPAVAFVTPLGSKTAGQIFKHWAVQAVLLDFKV
jgi:hypothetical protein